MEFSVCPGAMLPTQRELAWVRPRRRRPRSRAHRQRRQESSSSSTITPHDVGEDIHNRRQVNRPAHGRAASAGAAIGGGWCCWTLGGRPWHTSREPDFTKGSLKQTTARHQACARASPRFHSTQITPKWARQSTGRQIRSPARTEDRSNFIGEIWGRAAASQGWPASL